MALNYANSLKNYIEFSGIVCTRKEGGLCSQIEAGVEYFFLKKQKKIDLKALGKLRAYCVENKVQYIHAHSSSFFLAVLVKLTLPRVKIIWHNHLGASKDLKGIYLYSLKTSSFFFNKAIAVNEFLNEWNLKTLYAKSFYLSNFTTIAPSVKRNQAKLKGELGKKILYLANLRVEKNHFLLLEVAKLLQQYDASWSFHLVGKDFNDLYAKEVKERIVKEGLQQNVYVYGAVENVSSVIEQCEFGILTSLSEGLPVSLLEYGQLRKTVIASDVGDVGKLIINNSTGILVKEMNPEVFFEGIKQLIEDTALRNRLNKKFNVHIKNNYSSDAIVRNYLEIIEK